MNQEHLLPLREKAGMRGDIKICSPLDVKGVKLGITTGEIIEFIHECRRDK
jgi:hypothetical protein